MPFYEYQCKSCGHDLEAMQKISDRPLKKCPQCGKTQLQRLMSAGPLEKIYSHLLSLANFRRLLNRRSYFAIKPPNKQGQLN